MEKVRIFVKVKPNAKEYKVEKIDTDHFTVSVKEPPEKGKANKEVMELLAEYFKVPKSKITIRWGIKSKNKRIEILDNPKLY